MTIPQSHSTREQLRTIGRAPGPRGVPVLPGLGATHTLWWVLWRRLLRSVLTWPPAPLQVLLEAMVDAAENLCPNVMKKAHIRQDLIHASTEKISIPRAFVKNVLLEKSGIDILNKIR